MSTELLKRMCQALRHRGPDAEGLHVADGVGLAIRRLKVVDLETGDQPVFSEDGSVAVILNGEIYNFRELRADLARRGHRFATRSDTEVIVHLYEEQGVKCVEALHGMFAFALWDARRNQLVLARDRVGKKPLFYHHGETAFTFGSELNALMEDAEIPRVVDHQALDAYFALGYVPAPMSAFRSVRKLPPASTLVLRDGNVTSERYWRLDHGRKRDLPREDLLESIREHVRSAVRRRLVADVPLGAFLSGGIDSSAVVAAMAEASTEPVKTFSIGFASDRFNELPRARQVANTFGTDHHELVVEPDALDIVPRIVARYGEPFADSSAVPTFYLAELARRDVTVALTGDGGDECFAGYQRYVANALLHRLDRLPRPVRSSLARVGSRLPDSGTIDSPLSRVRRMSASLETNALDRYIGYVSHLNGLDRGLLYTDEYRELVGTSVAGDVIGTPWRESSGASVLDVILDVDTNTYLPGDLLVKMDISTMATSLEARSPLLDHELMELAASIPASLKVRGNQKKWIFRQALRGWIPDEILDGPKRGFELPVSEWFRGDLREYVQEVLLDPVSLGRGYFREAYVRDTIDRHVAGTQDNSKGLWSLLAFELWHRQAIDGVAP